MTKPPLPKNFDDRLSDAVQHFWETRSKGAKTQGGSRGNVISGKNLERFEELVRDIATHHGISGDNVFTGKGRAGTLPGFFRPTKNWDVVVVHNRRLLAVLEFKSQVGSFGNNFNNRVEEAIGNAVDLDEAVKVGTLAAVNHKGSATSTGTDKAELFRGYLMVLEDCTDSTKTVRVSSPHFCLDDEFEEASYADRYRLLFERLMERKLYDAAALLLTTRPSANAPAQHRRLSLATSAKNLFSNLAERFRKAT